MRIAENKPVAPVIIVLLVMCLASTGFAQERYRLDQGKWQKQTAIDPDTPEGQLQSIRKALAEDQANKALKLAKKWIKQHAGHAQLAEAHLLRGDAYVAKTHYFKALFDYELVIRQYPDRPQYIPAVERQYEIARLFASGVKRRWLGTRILSASGEAEEMFIRIQERLPGSEVGEKASLALGDLYFNRTEMNSATTAYDMFLMNYPRSSNRQHAMERLVWASLARFKGPKFDPTGLMEARKWIEQFQREFPASAERIGTTEMLTRIDGQLAAKSLSLARWYEKRGKRVSAAYMYRRLIRDHPNTAAALTAEERLAALKGPADVEQQQSED